MLSETITTVAKRILGVLLEEKASLSQIARITKTTKANIFLSLKRLEKEDLVRKEVLGRTHLYRFNFLHREAGEIMSFFLNEEKEKYNQKMENLPLLLHCLLKNIFGKRYQGCIFFGSSVKEKFKDIDVLVIVEESRKSLLRSKLKRIDEKISPVFGTRKELEKGISEEDMLYKNILKGVPFGCEKLVLKLRKRHDFLRRSDITERFILGYREILSCLEFKEPEYVEKHLEKGTMDVIYAALAYLDLSPENDYQAREKFKMKFGFVFSSKVETAKKQAEKIGKRVL